MWSWTNHRRMLVTPTKTIMRDIVWWNGSDEDAALIVAAPDLRDALQLVLDTYGFDSSTDSSIWQTVCLALDKAKAK